MCASYVGQQWSVGLEALLTHLALESLHLQVLNLPLQLSPDVNYHMGVQRFKGFGLLLTQFAGEGVVANKFFSVAWIRDVKYE